MAGAAGADGADGADGSCPRFGRVQRPSLTAPRRTGVTAAGSRQPIGCLDPGGEPVEIAEAARTRYHAALAVGSNGTAAVVSLARDLLLASGIETPERFLRGLASTSAANAAEAGAAALTGPVRRGDARTVAAHLADLEIALPEAVPAYRALAELALSYARRAGLDEQRMRAVHEVLTFTGQGTRASATD